MISPYEVLARIRYWRNVNRIGPDIPWTHWRLHFKSSMRALCSKKFAGFGEGAEFRPGAYAIECSRIHIGAKVVIRPATMLFADPRMDGLSITIEDEVMLGAGVHIYVANHVFADVHTSILNQGHSQCSPVVLRKGCWVGANCIILPGVEIGSNAVVGAGSVVTRSIPPGVVAVGSPARVVRTIEPEGRPA